MAGASAPPQTQEDIVPPEPVAVGFRLAGVLLAVAAAVSLHLVLVGPFGVVLVVPETPGSSTYEALTVTATVLVTFVVSIAAWVTVTVLERVRPATAMSTWTVLATVVYVMSLLPVVLLDIAAASRWGLVALHTMVAVVVIPSMRARAG